MNKDESFVTLTDIASEDEMRKKLKNWEDCKPKMIEKCMDSTEFGINYMVSIHFQLTKFHEDL